MAWSVLAPKTLDELYKVLSGISDTQSYVFRGHASASWDHLVPSLHRILPKGFPLGEQVLLEAKAIQVFRRHARSYVEVSELEYFERILNSTTLMQHYGAPTRLLDWTVSPWVACYFAVQDRPDDDALIWAFNRDELEARNRKHKSSRVSDFARFEELASANTVDEWLEAATRAGKYISTFQYDYANPQMSAQQSLFTIAGQLGDNHDEALTRSLPESWQTLKVIVPKQEKQRLRKRLFLMNVAPLNLFPNVDGVGLHIHEAIESGFELGGEGLVGRLEERIRERLGRRKRTQQT
jgi:hypothetical protein